MHLAAHGGYNFCALAGLHILQRGLSCDLDAQEHWLLHRQMKLEGGGSCHCCRDSCGGGGGGGGGGGTHHTV